MKFHKRITRKKLWLFIFLALLLLDIQLFAVYLSLKQEKETVTATSGVLPEVTYLADKNYDFKQLSGYFTQLANEKGAVYAFDVLKVAPIPPGIDMHLLGHLVGDILYKQKGVEGMGYCTQDFRNACSHSIVVAMFIKDGTNAIDKISDACRQAPGGKGAYTMCFHGLGHGVLAYTDYDMDRAVDLCKLTGTEAYQNREYIECVGGMVMEMMSGVNNPAAWYKQKPRYFSTTDPLAPCSTAVIPDEVKPICYIYLTPHLFEFAGANTNNPTPDDFLKAFTYCNRLDDSKLRDACFGGFGKEFVVLAQHRDIRRIDEMNEGQLRTVAQWCTSAKVQDGIDSCVNYATNSLYWGGENDRKAAIQFCSFLPTDISRTTCFTNLTHSITVYGRDMEDRRNYCTEIPKEYQATCMQDIQKNI